jgi:hypothetical protein
MAEWRQKTLRGVDSLEEGDKQDVVQKVKTRTHSLNIPTWQLFARKKRSGTKVKAAEKKNKQLDSACE